MIHFIYFFQKRFLGNELWCIRYEIELTLITVILNHIPSYVRALGEKRYSIHCTAECRFVRLCDQLLLLSASKKAIICLQTVLSNRSTSILRQGFPMFFFGHYRLKIIIFEMGTPLYLFEFIPQINYVKIAELCENS